MKYITEVDINKPLEEVQKRFMDPDGIQHWQKGFQRMEHISGELGQTNSQTMLYYKMGSRDMEMLETIIDQGMPDYFHASYEAPGMWNEQKNYFKVIDSNTTKWTSESEFIASKFMFKLMLSLMPGMFKKQTLKTMEAFKAYCENDNSLK